MKKSLLQLAFKLLPTQRQLPKLKTWYISLVVKIYECNFFSEQTIHIPIFNPVDLLGKGTQTFTSPAIETTTLRSISTSSTVSKNLQKSAIWVSWTRLFFFFVQIFSHMWWFFKIPQDFRVLHFEKSSKMAKKIGKTLEKPCTYSHMSLIRYMNGTIFPFLAHCEHQTSEKFHILAKVETKNNLFEFPLATNQSKNSIQTQIHNCKTNNNHQTGHGIIHDNDDEK